MHRSFALASLFALCLPQMVPAHPHIFVDTGLRLVADDQGRFTGVEVSWTYDDFYSLLILQDMGLDGDFDGVLTPQELVKLDGFDLNWIEGYQGDLYMRTAEAELVLGAPEGRGVAFEAGRITSRHFRPLAEVAAPVMIKVYDPTLYTAYELNGGISLPDGCVTTITSADVETAKQRLEEALARVGLDPDDYPEMGEAFADEITVTCGG